MPSDTRALLGPNAAYCDGRSLFLDRFPDPGAKDSGDSHPRRDWFSSLRGKQVWPRGGDSRREWTATMTADGRGELLFAQLQSRLMVNMAGGVMENAGLCLDRFGLPYIPGSAVKASARRMAIQALLESSIAGMATDKAARLLTNIALALGWGDADWKPGRKRKRQAGGWIETEPYSDFWWAMADDPGDRSADAQRNARWAEVSETAARALFTTLRATPREIRQPLAPQLPNFAGSVSFLPAYPFKSGASGLTLSEPDLGALDLDVVTCHHGEYYSDPDPNAKASDTREPKPVVFPALAAGHVFAFGMRPLRNCPTELLLQARAWLAGGLATFGLGAKTAAGYGWFDAGDKVQAGVLAALQRASLRPNPALWDEFLKWDDKQVRKAAAAFAFVALTPRTGREATTEYRFTLVKFVLEQRTALFVAQKSHAGSDFAKGVRRLAEEFQLSLP